MNKSKNQGLFNNLKDIETPILFFISLVLSTILIFINTNYNFILGILPSIVVILYSVILYLLQNNYNRILSQNEKDSPYFIGFTLTLVALGYIFFNLRTMFNSEFEKVPQVLLTGIAISITTTIAGVIGRYSIIVSDPRANKQAKLLTLFSNQTEEALAKYINAQEQLIKMVEDFKIESEEVYDDLEDIQVRVIDKLKKLDSQINEQLVIVNNNLKGSLEFYENGINGLNERIQKLTSIIDSLSTEAQKTNLTDSLFGNLEKFNEESQRVFKSIEVLVDDFSKDISSMQSIIKDNNENIYDMNKEVLESLKNSIINIREESIITNDSIDKLNDNTLSFTRTLKNSEQNISEIVNRTMNNIENGVGRTQQDLNAIDQLLNDFIKVMQKNLNHRA